MDGSILSCTNSGMPVPKAEKKNIRCEPWSALPALSATHVDCICDRMRQYLSGTSNVSCTWMDCVSQPNHTRHGAKRSILITAAMSPTYITTGSHTHKAHTRSNRCQESNDSNKKFRAIEICTTRPFPRFSCLQWFLLEASSRGTRGGFSTHRCGHNQPVQRFFPVECSTLPRSI